MSTANIVRGNVAEKLTIVAEIERTVAGSEEVSSGSKKEMERQKELDVFPQRLVKLETTDVKLLLESKEEVAPEEQRWSPSLDKNDPPRLPNIKAEKEEPWISQEGEQLQGMEEVDIIKFTFTPVTVKSEENDEEEPQSSQLYDNEKMKAETDGQDCGGPEPTRSFGLDTYLEPVTDDETSHSSESDTDDSCDWKETSEPQPGFNYLRNNEDPELNAGETPVSSSKSASRSCRKIHLHTHSGLQTEAKTFSCSVCGKNYISKNSLTAHTRLHSEGKSFSCSVCKKSFPYKSHVVMHMRVHTGEKPFSCSICSTSFKLKGSLKEHMRVHSGEKPFRCTVCDTSFTRRESLTEHIRIHTGEKPFRCSKCGRRFGQSGNLRRHMRIHGEEKPFRCPKCGRKFRHSGNMRRHMRIHIVETI